LRIVAAAVTRRRVLASGLAGGLGLLGLLGPVGCTPSAPGTGGTPCPCPPPAGQPTVPPAPDPLLAELADEERLLALYDAVVARHPALRPRLAAPRADHAQHVDALRRLLDASGTAAPPSSAAQSSGPAGTAGPPRVAATPPAALAALRAAERAAAGSRGAAALAAPSDRAGTLASISAAEATHVVVLS
jgi:hypothetical protein